MYVITVSYTPDEPGRVLGVIGQQGRGLTREATMAVKTCTGTSTLLTLKEYPLCVEPLVGLVGRLVSQIPSTYRPTTATETETVATYASLSVYGGRSVCESRLVEHLVATSNGLLLDVELFDEFDERRNADAARRYQSPLDLVEHAVQTVLWGGGAPLALQPLSAVATRGDGLDCRVLEGDVPAYTRRRLFRHLGGFRGPAPDALYASDWAEFLTSLARPDGEKSRKC